VSRRRLGPRIPVNSPGCCNSKYIWSNPLPSNTRSSHGWLNALLSFAWFLWKLCWISSVKTNRSWCRWSRVCKLHVLPKHYNYNLTLSGYSCCRSTPSGICKCRLNKLNTTWLYGIRCTGILYRIVYKIINVRLVDRFSEVTFNQPMKSTTKIRSLCPI
jgi:hypothetical protein